MATSLAVIRSTPYSIQVELTSTDSTDTYIRQAGAGVGEIDLTAFSAGPLKELLARSPDWSVAFVLDKLSFTRGYTILTGGGTNNYILTLLGGPPPTTVADFRISAALTPPLGLPAFMITPPDAVSGALFELTFKHSLSR
jgi:hypothetical protein